MGTLEDLQAACDRLNNMEHVDEEELAKLESEIEARLQALESENQRLLSENTQISSKDSSIPPETKRKGVNFEESGWEILEGVSDWLRTPKHDADTTDVEAQHNSPTPKDGGKERGPTGPLSGPKNPLRERETKHKIPSIPEKEEKKNQFTPLSQEQRNTLSLLDKWAERETKQHWGAKGQYGASGVRADLAQSYGRLLLKKTRPVSLLGERAIQDLESQLSPLRGRRSQEVELGMGIGESCVRASQELDSLLNRIEHEVKITTTSVARNVGGGVAAPGLIAFGEFYSRQSKLVQRGFLIGFILFFTIIYLMFYEEEEEVEEAMTEELDKDGIAFSSSWPAFNTSKILQ